MFTSKTIHLEIRIKGASGKIGTFFSVLYLKTNLTFIKNVLFAWSTNTTGVLELCVVNTNRAISSDTLSEMF